MLDIYIFIFSAVNGVLLGKRRDVNIRARRWIKGNGCKKNGRLPKVRLNKDK